MQAMPQNAVHSLSELNSSTDGTNFLTDTTQQSMNAAGQLSRIVHVRCFPQTAEKGRKRETTVIAMPSRPAQRGREGNDAPAVCERVDDVAHAPREIVMQLHDIDPHVSDSHLQPIVKPYTALSHWPAPTSTSLMHADREHTCQ